MKVKNRLLAVGSALALALVATSANAAVLIQGTGLWGAGTPTTSYSKAGTSYQFSFELPNPFGSSTTTAISDFFYSFGKTTVSTIPTSVTFYDDASSGMFDLNFLGTSLSFYGADIGSTGKITTGTFGSIYNVTAGLNGGAATGTGNIATTTVGAVPEPSTWAMMIIGFGALGMAMRRRRVRTTVSYA